MTSPAVNVTLSLHPLCTMATLTPKMPEPSQPSLISTLDIAFKRIVLSLQNYSFLLADTVVKMLSPPFYFEDVLEQTDLIGVGSLPIILLTGLFIGGVMVLNTAQQFQRFGETAITGYAVSLALVRELGPVIAGLLVTGRNGSAIASELGSMVVTEQVDAMRALGVDPVRKLVVPRVLATLIALPLLTAVADLVGLIGGYIVSHFMLGLSAPQFWNQAIQALAFGDLVMGITKPVAFALLISTIGCFYGLRTQGGTQGVGRSTTSAVVAGSITIIIFDFFLQKLLMYWFVR
ncbi:MAG TPA: ABC transporter permease [Candidatus Acidoferrales bacterium]|nr:ABC transporter permease [Candidatus Acidoferrales bacterium]